MHYERFVLGPLETNVYLLYTEGKEACLVDPVLRDKRLEGFIEKKGLVVESVVITHAHVDHFYDAESYVERYRVPVYMHEKAEALRPFFRASCGMHGFAEKEMLEHYTPLNRITSFQVGEESLRILTTPGHSLCGISLASGSFVITGDVLFKGDMGRYDLPGSSLAQLYASLKKLAALPDELEVLPGHLDLSTLGAEKRENEYLKTALRSAG